MVPLTDEMRAAVNDEIRRRGALARLAADLEVSPLLNEARAEAEAAGALRALRARRAARERRAAWPVRAISEASRNLDRLYEDSPIDDVVDYMGGRAHALAGRASEFWDNSVADNWLDDVGEWLDEAGDYVGRQWEGSVVDRNVDDALEYLDEWGDDITDRARLIRAKRRARWAKDPATMERHELWPEETRFLDSFLKSPPVSFLYDTGEAILNPFVRRLDPERAARWERELPHIPQSELKKRRRSVLRGTSSDPVQRVHGLVDEYSLPTEDEVRERWRSPYDRTTFATAGAEAALGGAGGRLDAGVAWAPRSRVLSLYYALGGDDDVATVDDEGGVALGVSRGAGISESPAFLTAPAYVLDANWGPVSPGVSSNDPVLRRWDKAFTGDWKPRQYSISQSFGLPQGLSQFKTSGHQGTIDLRLPPDYLRAFLETGLDRLGWEAPEPEERRRPGPPARYSRTPSAARIARERKERAAYEAMLRRVRARAAARARASRRDVSRY